MSDGYWCSKSIGHVQNILLQLRRPLSSLAGRMVIVQCQQLPFRPLSLSLSLSLSLLSLSLLSSFSLSQRWLNHFNENNSFNKNGYRGWRRFALGSSRKNRYMYVIRFCWPPRVTLFLAALTPIYPVILLFYHQRLNYARIYKNSRLARKPASKELLRNFREF